jgi:hypothetical protein
MRRDKFRIVVRSSGDHELSRSCERTCHRK